MAARGDSPRLRHLDKLSDWVVVVRARRHRRRLRLLRNERAAAENFGGRPLWSCAVIVVLHALNSPWSKS